MNSQSEYSPQFVIPVGTQVVLRGDQEALLDEHPVVKRAGCVGAVVELPDEATGLYAVRFSDGALVRAAGSDVSVRKALAPEEGAPDRAVDEYRPHLILRATLGSQAYGLATADSDVDEKGIFLPPAAWHWSLVAVPEQVEFQSTPDGDDFCWWEIEKFLRLALRANPTVLELLFVSPEHTTAATDIGRELLAMRECFLSKFIYQTYSGYALSQFRRMKRALDAGKEPKAKHAMHLVRLLLSGIAALRTGVIQVDVGQHRDELLTIKSGTVPFDDVHRRAIQLEAEFRDAFESSTLPDRPDAAAVDSFLIRARRSAV